jgi:uncharacterized protein YqeY
MSQTLKFKITEAVKDAMRAQAKARLSTLRMATAAIKQKEIDQRIELDDAQIVDIIVKMIKQRKEAAAQYQIASRTDLLDKELAEVAVLEEFLPPRLDDAAIDTLIQTVISAQGTTSAKDMGKVMAELKIKLGGGADMALVGQKVKKFLPL